MARLVPLTKMPTQEVTRVGQRTSARGRTIGTVRSDVWLWKLLVGSQVFLEISRKDLSSDVENFRGEEVIEEALEETLGGCGPTGQYPTRRGQACSAGACSHGT